MDGDPARRSRSLAHQPRQERPRDCGPGRGSDRFAGRPGPTLGRPLVDRVKGSQLHNLKELRPGSSAQTEIRTLFVFDPKRQAVLLVAGVKAGVWSQWYSDNIP